MDRWIDYLANCSFYVACRECFGVPFTICPSHDEAGTYCMGGEL